MNTQIQATNPFGENQNNMPAKATERADSERAIQEVQAAMVIAKKFPRDMADAMNRILQSCTRPTLAENAVYAYPRGGQTVTGASIRLAEAIAQQWGNIQYGIRELSQHNGSSTVEAFAWDIETNTRQTKVFHVDHVRGTRQGLKTLTDPRDIYELVANQGARRLRACILGIIPGDVTEQAVKQCELTMQNTVTVDKESIQKLTDAFSKFKVTPEMLSKRLGGKHLESMIGAEMINLRNIYKSIKDGMAKPHDFFDIKTETTDTSLDEALGVDQQQNK